MEFSSTTGDYRFTDCLGGITLTGQGRVKVRTCKVELRDSGPDHHIKAKADLCANSGRTTIDFVSRGLTLKVKDRDISDNGSPCR